MGSGASDAACSHYRPRHANLPSHVSFGKIVHHPYVLVLVVRVAGPRLGAFRCG